VPMRGKLAGLIEGPSAKAAEHISAAANPRAARRFVQR
jgi:hypothetical protein